MADKRKVAVVFHLHKPYDLAAKINAVGDELEEQGYRVIHKTLELYDTKHDAVANAHTVIVPDIAGQEQVKKDFAGADVQVISLQQKTAAKTKTKTKAGK